MHLGSSAQVFREGGSNRPRSRWHRAHGGQPNPARPEDGPPLGFFFYPFIRLGAGWAVTPKEPAVDGPDGSNNSLAMHTWFTGGWNCCEMGANGHILFGVAESHCWFPIGEHGGNHIPQTMFCPMARMINQSISTCNSWVDEPLLLSNVTVAQPNLNPLVISHRHGK